MSQLSSADRARDALTTILQGTARETGWFEDLLQQEHRRCPAGLRILDVAAGGARYVRDFLAGLPTASGVDVTLIDQDPAATAFCQGWSSSAREAQVRSYTLAISRLGGELADREFDVVLSAGLFDYLNDATARTLLEQLSSLLAPGGVLAFSNFHPEDPSRLVKGWLADWHLLYRDEQSCAALLPASLSISTARSANRALTYAVGPRGDTARF
jgi:SAM-dependent methyltransferase